MVTGVSHASEYQAVNSTLSKQPSAYELYYQGSPYDDSIEGVSFDSKNCIITLDNVKLDFYGTGFNIKSNSGNDFKIVVKVIGNNNLNGMDNYNKLFSVDNDLRFTGNGSLNVSNARLIESKGNVSVACKKVSVNNASGYYGAIETTKNVVIGSGSKVSITADDSGDGIAIDAKKMKNSYKSLGKIRGRMPVGAEIYNKNGVYKVKNLSNMRHSDYDSFGVTYKDNTVSLLKWLGGKSVKFTGVMTNKIMGFEYRTVAVKKNAFSTKAGKKVENITINPNTVVKFEAQALNNTKSLTDFYFGPESQLEGAYIRPLLFSGNALIKNYVKGRYGEFLSGAGKANGKQVTVHVAAGKKFYHPEHSGDHYDNTRAWHFLKGTGKFEKDTQDVMKQYGMKHAPKVTISSKFYMTKKEQSTYIQR